MRSSAQERRRGGRGGGRGSFEEGSVRIPGLKNKREKKREKEKMGGNNAGEGNALSNNAGKW